MANLEDDNAEVGATSTEYALLVTLIAIVILAAVWFFGQEVLALFDATEIESAVN